MLLRKKKNYKIKQLLNKKIVQQTLIFFPMQILICNYYEATLIKKLQYCKVV